MTTDHRVSREVPGESANAGTATCRAPRGAASTSRPQAMRQGLRAAVPRARLSGPPAPARCRLADRLWDAERVEREVTA